MGRGHPDRPTRGGRALERAPGAHRASDAALRRAGQGGGRDRRHRAARQARLPRDLGLPGPRSQPVDEGRRDLPHLLDVEGDHRCRGDDAPRGAGLPAHRSGLALAAGAARPEGRGRVGRSRHRRARLPARAHRARHERARSPHAQLGPLLRRPARRAGRAPLQEAGHRRLEQRPHARRPGEEDRRGAASRSAGNGLALRPLDRRSRAAGGSDVRPAVRRVPRIEDLPTAAHARHRVLGPGGEEEPVDGDLPARRRRQAASLCESAARLPQQAEARVRRRRARLDHAGLPAFRPDAARRRRAGRPSPAVAQDGRADGERRDRRSAAGGQSGAGRRLRAHLPRQPESRAATARSARSASTAGAAPPGRGSGSIPRKTWSRSS